MKVTYTGDHVRTNQYGTFEPGKSYEVSKETAEKLVKVRRLFSCPELPVVKPAPVAQPVAVEEPEEQVEETEVEDVEDEYSQMSKKELMALCDERSISYPKKAKQAELAALLRLPAGI